MKPGKAFPILISIGGILFIIAFGLIYGFQNLNQRGELFEKEHALKSRPNIILIVADDLGWSDVGAYGSEILTPNIDLLASRGAMFTNFHVNTTCSPTRAMLYSGVDSHLAGYGTMAGLETPEQIGRPGYEVFLNDRVVAFPELLQEAGYNTYIAGKWDQGGRNGQGKAPHKRGFDGSFVLVEGLADHFREVGVYNLLSPPTYLENGKKVKLPEDFFSSRTYADKVINFLREDRDKDKPFFAMLSFTAPHYPLQAFEEDIRSYETVYQAGYEKIRAERIKRLHQMGLFSEEHAVADIFEGWPKWDELSPEMQNLEAIRMAAYAAMITEMDRHIGRVLQAVEEEGLVDNTIVIFMSDNGPDQSNPLDTAAFINSLDWMKERYSFSLSQTGRPGSFTWTGPVWASVSSTPWAFHKHYMSRGGTNVPLIISMPGQKQSGVKINAFATVLDLLPTFLELAETKHPGKEYKGRKVFEPAGDSLIPLINGSANSVHDEDYVFGLEIFDRRMLQKGGWKIVWANPPWGKNGEWSLYHLDTDPAETDDLADQEPEKLKELLDEWEKYVERNGVILNPGFELVVGATKSHYEWRPPELLNKD